MGGTYMQYYKLVASLAEVDAAAARKKTFGEKAVLSSKSNEFNKHFHDRAFFYVEDIIDNVLTVGIICAEDIDINKQFPKYANALDMLFFGFIISSNQIVIPDKFIA